MYSLCITLETNRINLDFHKTFNHSIFKLSSLAKSRLEVRLCEIAGARLLQKV